MINNVVLVSGVQQSDSVMHIHVSIIFHILFPSRLLQNIEQLTVVTLQYHPDFSPGLSYLLPASGLFPPFSYTHTSSRFIMLNIALVTLQLNIFNDFPLPNK